MAMGDCVEMEPLVRCALCLSEYTLPHMYKLETCGCIYCRMCVIQYIEVMVSEGSVLSITCPDAMCKTQGKLETHEIAKLIDSKLFDRYARLKYEREIDLDPSRTWCPQAGCETVCHVPEAGEDAIVPANQPPSLSVTCAKCGLQFCSACKAKWHSSQTCDEVQGGQDGIPFSSDIEADIKRCPVCRVPIERDKGCAQMMCKQCKHVFCWYCLESLDDDFMLRHYDKGPCKNKLGHSRSSVIWHRIQVVGLFASFGLLVLVASPFLLLAAPCLLCCRCKLCRKLCKCFDACDPEKMDNPDAE